MSKIGAPDGVQWHLILPAGLGVGVVVTALFYYLPVLMINHYATVLFFLGQDAIWGVGIERFGFLIGRYGMPALYLLLTVLAASWVGRRVRATGPLHGVLTGVVSALVSMVLSQAIGLYFGPPDPIELVLYPTLAIGGGFLGGLRGWTVLAGHEVLYKASREVSAARSIQAIVAAIGEQLAGSEVSDLGLWEATWPDGAQREGVPGGVRTPRVLDATGDNATSLSRYACGRNPHPGTVPPTKAVVVDSTRGESFGP